MELLFEGFAIVLVPSTFIYIVFGTLLGVLFGALPGVSSSMACILAFPFTYAISPLPAIAFLVTVYCSAVTGGGITAILFKIPGTPSSACTCLDGYPMLQRGEAAKALGISLITSAIGGMFSAICMLLLAPQLSSVALRFGPSELFAVSFLGLSVMTALDQGNSLRTIISGLMGLGLACVGIDPIQGFKRLTFGSITLMNGMEMVPVMVGLFAVVEVLNQTVKRTKLESVDETTKNVKVKVWGLGLLRMKATILRSCVIGTIVGILPGSGSTIASFMSYVAEVKSSRNPELYGNGEPRGVAASETANNAATGGSMVPLLSMGIPGGAAAAVMLAALTIKGVQMGPLLLQKQPEYLATVFAAEIITNILMVIVSIGLAYMFSKILDIPYSYLGTIILLLSTVGAFALNNNTNHVVIMVIAAIVGCALVKYKFSPSALILGLVLGELCESNFRRAVLLSKNVIAFFKSPITIILISAAVLMLVYPLASPIIKRKIGKIIKGNVS
jgi:putative tricarboxylic transport membrane protein